MRARAHAETDLCEVGNGRCLLLEAASVVSRAGFLQQWHLGLLFKQGMMGGAG